MTDKRIYRSLVDRIIGGVCGGFAEYFEIDPTLVRVIWVMLCFLGGVGFFAYFASLVVMRDNPNQDATQRKRDQNGGVIVGVIVILIGLLILSSRWNWHFFNFSPFQFRMLYFDWDRFVPVVIILAGILYIYHILKREKKMETSKPTDIIVNERKLFRSQKDKMIGGVCSGLADYMKIDPVLVRVPWIMITLFSGFLLGVIAYIILLIVVPEENDSHAAANVAPPTTKRSRPRKGSNQTKEKKNE